MPVVAAIQMEIGRDKAANLDKACALLAKAAARGAQLACLPEYFLADCPEKGMGPEETARIAETMDGPAITLLRTVARAESLYVCAGSFIEADGADRLRNTSALIGPDGAIVGTYSKAHPENAAPKYEVGCGIVPGDSYPVFETGIGRIGIAVDMDMDVPEVPRILRLQGAEIVLWPINWSVRWYRTLEAYAAAHCMMNAFFVVAANRVGTRTCAHGTFIYHGGSRVVDPEGCAIAQATDYYEGMALADLDIGLLRLWRETIVPRDYPYARRPETYGMLTDTSRRFADAGTSG
jgi:predicted amidohydrolase